MSKENVPQNHFLPRSWEVPLREKMKEGAIVKGRIGEIRDFGATLEIIPGIEGFIRVPEVSWTESIDMRNHFKINQEVQAKIIWLDRENRRMYLSIKQLTEDPWNKITEKYPLKSRHTGVVKKIAPFGVFTELEYDICGMILLSDLSWTKQYNHPSEFTQIGQRIEVMILNLDVINRKLSLGHKQVNSFKALI